MRKIKFFLSLLMLFCFSVGNVWATTITMPATTLDLNTPTMVETASLWKDAKSYYLDDDMLIVSGYASYQNVSKQTWITYASTGSSNTAWNANDPFKGAAYYTTGSYATLQSGRYTAYLVTNCDSVWWYCKNNNTSRKALLNIYDVTGSSATSIDDASVDATYSQSNTSTTAEMVLKQVLNASKTYLIVTTATGSSNSRSLEIAFFRHNSTPSVTVDPTSVAFGDVKQHTKTDDSYWVLSDVKVTGKNLTDNVKLTSNYSPVFNIEDKSKGSGVSYTYTLVPDGDGAIDTTINVVAYTNSTGNLDDKTITVSSAKETPEFTAFDIPVTINLIPTYSISVPAITGGSLGWDPAKPEYAAEGDAFTLTATPASGYEGGTIQILKAEDDSDVTSDVLSGSTLTMPAYAIKVVVTFTEQTCTNLAAPTLNSASTWYTYEAGQLAWTAVEHADKYLVNISKHSGEAYITNLLTPDLNTGMNNLAANTQYDYTVMAVGDGSTYCDESNPLLEGSFTTEDYPAATLTLSENGVEHALAGSHKLNDVVALPTTAENACFGKVLVGWSADADRATAPEYAKGADYTLAATSQKLYAVYAKETAADPSLDTYKLVSDLTVGKKYIFASSNAAGDAYALPAKEMQTSAANSAAGVAITISSVDAKPVITTVNADLEYVYEELRAKAGTHTRDTLKLQVAEDATNYLCVNGSGLNKRAWSTSTKAFWNNGLYGTNGAGSTVYYVEYKSSDHTFNKGGSSTSSPVYAYERTSAAPSYSDYSTTCVTPELTSIELSEDAFECWKGENLPKPTVTAHFSAGAEDQDVTATATFSAFDPTQAGAQEITVTYEFESVEKSATYTVTVKTIANDVAHPYTVAQARALIDAGKDLSTAVYATGIVSQIVTPYSDTFHNITYNFSADGLTTSDQLQAFRGKYTDGADFSEADTVLVGDSVIVYGTLTKYSSTYEFTADNQLAARWHQAGLAWSAEEVSAYTAGKAYTLPTLSNPNNLPVTYTSSNFYALDIDASTGEISNLVAGQTTTITATFAGNDTYAAQAVSYTLKIYKPSSLAISGELTTTEYDDGDTFVFDGLTASLTFSDETVEDVTADATWKADGVTTKVLAWPANEFYVEASYPGVMAALKNVTISFKTYAVTFAAPEHGTLVVKNSGNPIGSGNTFVKNTTLTVEATPDAGYELATLTAGGVDIKEAKQFTVGTAAVEVAATFALSQVDPELSWSGVDGYNRAWAYTQGKAFAFPTLNNPNGVEVTYSADGGIITIDETTGVIELVSEGAVHVTATSAATSTYLAGTATYTLYVCGVEYVTLGGDADKKVYEYGDAFDRTGLTVTANYNNGGGTSDVTELATWTIDPETITSNGSVSVTATYAGKSDQKYVYDVKVASYAVTFNTPEHGSMAVTAGGDYFLSGAKFKKGTEVVVTLTPDAGYEGSVTVNGEPLVGNSFNIGTEDVDIVATFTAIPKYFLKSNWANGGWAWLEATYVSATNYTLANVVLGNGGGVNWDGESKADVNWTKYNEFLDYNEGAALDTVTLVLNPVAGTITATLVGKYVAPADPVYTVVGVEALVGYDWGAGLNAAENEMAKQTDGTYLLLKENIILAVADYEYQVAKDHDWRGVSNSKLSIATAGKYNVTFTFNPATGETNAEAEFVEAVVLNNKFVVLGGFNGWSADAVEVAPDAATASFVVNIATANDYFFKVQVNSAWLANGYTYHRDFTGAAGITENGSDMKLQADVAGEYTFTWTFETNALEITFPAKGPGTGINDIDAEGKVEKIFRDGKFYILKGEKTYTIQGQLVK